MDSITVIAPAKVNLFLKVLGKRPDGYHNIDTLFEKITLSDTITLRKSDAGINITSDAAGVPLDEKNLAYKAALLLQAERDRTLGVDITIEKSIDWGYRRAGCAR
jgi:4-diphosphocytidyl-2-C-methyl-D-erythritol kinase